jgi:hypothetical protein
VKLKKRPKKIREAERQAKKPTKNAPSTINKVED